jgi:hypothetical protein
MKHFVMTFIEPDHVTIVALPKTSKTFFFIFIVHLNVLGRYKN